MPLIPWSDKFELGIKEIDEQHKKILELINKSYDIFESKKYKDQAELEKILKEMGDYAIYHFGVEENYFKLYDYEKAESHTEVHNQYRAKFQEWRQEYLKDRDNDGKTAKLFFEISTFLQDWWIWHINNTDRDYVPFMKANHVS